MLRKICLLAPLLLMPMSAQNNSDQQEMLRQVLHRLDTLEQQNRELLEEVKKLKQQSQSHNAETPEPNSQSAPPLEERVKVNEERIAEQAQTKVESSQKFPIWLYGTLLFNSFYNDNKDAGYALGRYGLLTGAESSGATVRQTVLGLNFQGPTLPGDGRFSGNLEMDFWSGPPGPSSNWLRIRRAGLLFDWTNTTFFVGQDKPLISPYQPDSLAEVAVPALSGSGNLWYWLPQARLTHTFHVASHNGIDAQAAVLQTGSYLDLPAYTIPGILAGGVRPALEGRGAFWHKNGDTKKFEIAPGFHVSTDRVNGTALTSRIGSFDWLYNPFAILNVKGAAYYGEDVAALGALGNGFYLAEYGTARPVVSDGGWAQVSAPLTNRVTLNLFGGLEHDRANGIRAPGVAQTSSVAGNMMFHLTSSMVFSLEAQHLWTATFAGTPETYNHYDLAVAYLF